MAGRRGVGEGEGGRVSHRCVAFVALIQQAALTSRVATAGVVGISRRPKVFTVAGNEGRVNRP